MSRLCALAGVFLLACGSTSYGQFGKPMAALAIESNGERAVSIGPEGGTIPYTINAFVGGHTNGFRDVVVNVLTNIGVPQKPLINFGAEFERYFVDASLGMADDDDILSIGGAQSPDDPVFGLGEFPDGVLLGEGQLTIPSAPIGTEFIVRPVGVQVVAFVGEMGATTSPPVLPQELEILVIPEPNSSLLFILALIPLLVLRKN